MKNLKALYLEQRNFFFAAPALVWQLLFCVLPLLFVVSISFFDKEITSLTLDNYCNVLNSPHLKIVFRSLSLATVTSLLCLIVGYPIAYWISRRLQAFKNLFIFLLIIPFWSNLLVLIYSWVFILEKYGLLNNFLIKIGLIAQPLPLLNTNIAIVLVAFYCYLPFMVLPIYASLDKLDKNLLEASADLGASPWQTFLHVVVPLSWQGIRSGILLVFVPIFGEFTIPLLMGGDKYMFLGNAISHYVFIALDLPRSAALTIISVCCLIVTLIALLAFIRFIIYLLQKVKI